MAVSLTHAREKPFSKIAAVHIPMNMERMMRLETMAKVRVRREGRRHVHGCEERMVGIGRWVKIVYKGLTLVYPKIARSYF